MTCRIFFGEPSPSVPLGKSAGKFVTGTKTVILARNAVLLGLALCFATTVLGRTAAADPAQLISDFRLKHGEKRRHPGCCAHADCPRSGSGDGRAGRTRSRCPRRFNLRVGPAGAGRPQRTLRTAMTVFPKPSTSGSIRQAPKNLLLPGATRVGVASVKRENRPDVLGHGDRRAYENPKKPKSPPASSPKSSPKKSKQANTAKPKSRRPRPAA